MHKSNKSIIKNIFKFLMLTITLLGFTSNLKAEIKVVTTIQPLHSIISNVMGSEGNLNLILEGTASPHSFTFKPSHAKMIQEADIIFWVGEDLENFLEKPLKLVSKKSKIISFMELSKIKKLKFREKNIYGDHDDHDKHGHKKDKHGHKKDDHDDHDKHGHKDSHGHAHGEFDVHIWLDPVNAKVIVEEVAHTLEELDPSNAKLYAENAKKTLKKLDLMIKNIDESINKNASFVTFHDAYQYFEKRFGIEALGALTINTDIQPGAKQISEIKKLVEDKNIKCIFSEPQFNPKLINMIASNTGAKTGILDPLGSSYKPGKSLYFNLIKDLYKNLNKC